MPREVMARRRENVTHKAWGVRIDVAIGADKPSGDSAYPVDDAGGPTFAVQDPGCTMPLS
jgi:hypothetical protein